MSRAAFATACALAGAWVLSRAWIADDAFITWRVIDNLLAGHGLRWNADERVQVFTHPLWALLHVPLAAATGSLVAASFLLSALCLAGAAVFAFRATGGDRGVFALALLAPLAASRAFADHAVSGLESPLVALCAAAFAAKALAPRAPGAAPPWLGLSLAASLLATARPDAVLLVLPCVAALALVHGVLSRAVLVGALPLVAWHLFALFYYGFALPNTFYAKLGAGIPALALARQGLFYAADLVRRDAGSALLLAVALVVVGARAREALRPGRAAGDGIAVASLGAGIALHAGYTIAVGGDFMSGRFFAPAVFLAALLLARALRGRTREAGALAAGVLAASLASFALRPADPDATWHGIADERRVFERATSLWRRPGFRDGAPERHPWFRAGRAARERALASGRPEVIVRGAVGMFGYAAGPEVIVVDEFALGDALLARRPAATARRWRIGHFRRELPAGYLHARATGDASRMPAELATLWQDLRLVTSGALLDPERWRAIGRVHRLPAAGPTR